MAAETRDMTRSIACHNQVHAPDEINAHARTRFLQIGNPELPLLARNGRRHKLSLGAPGRRHMTDPFLEFPIGGFLNVKHIRSTRTVNMSPIRV